MIQYKHIKKGAAKALLLMAAFFDVSHAEIRVYDYTINNLLSVKNAAQNQYAKQLILQKLNRLKMLSITKIPKIHCNL